jgi:predicted ArsR family transcriptional regulator
MESPPRDVLFLLKTRGPSRTLELARHLNVSRQAVRMQMERLAGEGLVEHVVQRGGVGRPGRSWSLTEKAQQRFPDTHAQMTVELIDAVREEFGTQGLERLIARRETATRDGYRRALSSAKSLDDRLKRLAQVRAAEGYMAEWRAQEDGSYLLLENHCPICAAAEACQGFCRSELMLFRALLAPATVERTEHILAGARRCAYKVSP